MKKMISWIVALALCCSMVACSGPTDESDKTAVSTGTLQDASNSAKIEEKAAAETSKDRAGAGEPLPKGDGKLSYLEAIRLIRYFVFHYSVGLPLHYEEMVKFVDCEGEDRGKDKESGDTKFSNHLVRWYAGDPNTYVDFTFKRADNMDDWTAYVWAAQKIEYEDLQVVDISGELDKKLGKIKSSPKKFAMTVHAEGGGDEISLKLKVDIPEAGWFLEDQAESEQTITLYHTYATKNPKDYGKIVIKVYSSKDRPIQEANKIEKEKEVDALIVSGASLSGITGWSPGTRITYWYGQLENGAWISVALQGLDMSDADRVMALVHSITVE